MDFITNVFNKIDDFMYFPILVIVLAAAGLYFTIRTKGVQIRLFGTACKLIVEKPANNQKVSSFQALMVSTASRVGTGNIVGVSTAICLGGPGACFWMWLMCVIGASSAFIESTLAQIFKQKDKDGHFFDKTAVRNADLEDFLVSFVEEGIDISRQVTDPDFIYDKSVIWENPGADMERFRREIGKNYEMIDRGHGFWENVPLGFSKATAINVILEKLGIPWENTYAIGDSTNDLSMIRAAGCGVVMGNGLPEVLKEADYVTAGNDEDGVAKAVLFLNGLE